jgi:outer membrane protein OmpA-like peptidoglycan-associated protein
LQHLGELRHNYSALLPLIELAFQGSGLGDLHERGEMLRRNFLKSALGVALVSVLPAVSGTSQAAGLLILASSGSEFVRDCSNRDVVISASNSKYILAGHCLSLSIPGDGNQIIVDLAPGAELELRGSGNQIAWTSTGSDEYPRISSDGQSNYLIKLEREPPKRDAVSASNAPISGEATAAKTEPSPAAGDAGAKSAASTKSTDEIKKDLGVRKVDMANGRPGEASEMPSQLLFAVNSAELRTEALDSLAEYAEMIRRNGSKNVHIIGHTDSIGDFWYNMELSRRRAQSVKAWLVHEGGLANSALTAIGLGAQSPKSTNATPVGRSQNRRVELLAEICCPRDRKSEEEWAPRPEPVRRNLAPELALQSRDFH